MAIPSIPGLRGFRRRRAMMRSFKDMPPSPANAYFASQAGGFDDPGALQAALKHQAKLEKVSARNSKLAHEKLAALTADSGLSFRRGNQIADDLYLQYNNAYNHGLLSTAAYDRSIVGLHVLRNPGLLNSPNYYSQVGSAVSRLGGPAFAPVFISRPAEGLAANLSLSPTYLPPQSYIPAQGLVPTNFSNPQLGATGSGYISAPSASRPDWSRIQHVGQLDHIPPFLLDDGVTNSRESKLTAYGQIGGFLRSAKTMPAEEFKIVSEIMKHNINELTTDHVFDKNVATLLKTAIDALEPVPTKEAMVSASEPASAEEALVSKGEPGPNKGVTVGKSEAGPNKGVTVGKSEAGPNKGVTVGKSDAGTINATTLGKSAPGAAKEMAASAGKSVSSPTNSPSGKSWPDDNKTYEADSKPVGKSQRPQLDVRQVHNSGGYDRF